MNENELNQTVVAFYYALKIRILETTVYSLCQKLMLQSKLMESIQTKNIPIH